jgi:hypothetical protein
MARYRCPRCHEITHRPNLFTPFCGICSAPLTVRDMLPPEGSSVATPAPEPVAAVTGSHPAER